jgi:hypothetical protein
MLECMNLALGYEEDYKVPLIQCRFFVLEFCYYLE